MLRLNVVGAPPRQAREAMAVAAARRYERPVQGGIADPRAARRLHCAAMIAAVGRETVWWKRHA
jgi:hypothetical protein